VAAERAALRSAALRGSDDCEYGAYGSADDAAGSAPLAAAQEFVLTACTPGAAAGAPPLRHRLHALVEPGRAAVATAVAAPEP
jgi:hypothetical protein